MSFGAYVKPMFDGETHSVCLAGDQKIELEPNTTYTGLTFNRIDLSGLSLTSCRFENCLFQDCRIEFTEFSHTHFTNTNFLNSTLTGSVFLFAKMLDVTIDSCDCNETRFNYGQLKGCVVLNSNLAETNWHDTKANNLLIKDCFLDACQMVGTTLVESRIESCIAKDKSWLLRQAILQNVIFENFQAWKVTIIKCSLIEVVADRSNFYQARIFKSTFKSSTLVHTGFNESRLIGCTFLESRIHGCRFRLAKLFGTFFESCSFNASSLEMTDLSKTIFWETDLKDNYTGNYPGTRYGLGTIYE